jgi:Dehydrogenases with different specificities (related to short-chain alcohol dehydrogenases)
MREQVVIVTGGASGIGKAICRAFAGQGAKVAIFDVNAGKGEALKQELAKMGGESESFQVDVSSEPEVRQAVQEVIRKWGTVDVLVNNAGISNPATAEHLAPADWDRIIGVNLSGAFYCAKAVIGPMKERGRGKIVNIASVGGKRISFAGGVAYTASKAGLIGLTRHLAYELMPFGINVNCVCPGGTMTELYERITDEELIRERVDMIPAGRLCRPEDIADAVLFLTSDNANMICGVALDVDGGSLLGWMNVNKYYAKRDQLSQRSAKQA